jgi:hypothetical protein
MSSIFSELSRLDCAIPAENLSFGNKVRCPLTVRVALDPVGVLQQYSGIKLDPWQAELANPFVYEDTFILSGRQCGKSTAAIHAGLAWALTHSDQLILIISIVQRQSNFILKELKRLLYKLPYESRPNIVKDTVTHLELSNGTQILALPSGSVNTGAGIRGLSPDLLILDECARIQDSIFWDVISPMVSVTRGRKIFLTTPGSQYGWAWTTYSEGLMKIIQVRADQCPRISAKFLEKEKLKLPKSSYRREYENVWTSVNAGLFDIDAVNAAFQDMPDNPFKRKL